MTKRILVAEADEGLLTLLRVKLELSGYSVTAVPNGAQALGLAAWKPPDVLLADVKMPVMDGLEMLQRLRAFSDVPVIMFGGGEHASEALRLGASDFLAKPFDVNELMDRVVAALQLPRMAGSANPVLS